MTEPSLPLRDSFLLSPRTANYIAALDSRAKCNRALREPDLHVFAKLFEDCLKRSLEAQAFLGVRLAVMTMSWISWSDTLSMSI
jgi:hypothetical protein